jgi:hypothetical protein
MSIVGFMPSEQITVGSLKMCQKSSRRDTEMLS